MRIAITGASGLIGQNLSKYLLDKGYEIVALNRDIIADTEKLNDIIAGCDVVINLAGESIAKRWTKENKHKIYNSRIDTTSKIVEAINNNNYTNLLISASAIGYYSPQIISDESSINNEDNFITMLCKDWENEALKVRKDVRVVITRLGVVLDKSGGAFTQISKSLNIGIGVVLGDGSNYFSWISLTDVLLAMSFFIENDKLKGVFNLTVPTPCTYKELIHEICSHYITICKINIPTSIVRLLLGEASQIILGGQYVIPKRLIDEQFKFKKPTLEAFFNEDKK